MIFFLIAGTATPAFLLDTHGALRAGLPDRDVDPDAHRRRDPPDVDETHRSSWSARPFVGLGWAAGLALPWVWIHAGVAPAALMLAGGLLYTAGALSYHRRWPNPYPSVFGYHEVFHAYVSAAAACQFVAIAWFIA